VDPEYYLVCVNKLVDGPWKEDIQKYGLDPVRFEVDGIQCGMKRGNGYTWLAYLKLPESHWLAKKSDEELSDYVHVHGGFTYSDGHGVFGFDHAHGGFDAIPGVISHLTEFGVKDKYFGHYWTFEEVKDNLTRAARELLALKDQEKYDANVKPEEEVFEEQRPLTPVREHLSEQPYLTPMQGAPQLLETTYAEWRRGMHPRYPDPKPNSESFGKVKFSAVNEPPEQALVVDIDKVPTIPEDPSV
jgi:hypothetical protein